MSDSNAQHPTEGAIPPEAIPQIPTVGSSTILIRSLWFGLVVGLSELVLLIALKPFRDPSPGFFRMDRHIVWMIPTFNLMLFIGVGLLLAVAAKFRPRIGSRVSTGVLAFLGILTVLLTYPRLHAAASVMLAFGLAFRLSRRLERHDLGFRRFVGLSLPVVGIAAIGVAGSSFYREMVVARRIPADLPSIRASTPNVLLIVLDTVRADRLSLYGYGRPTSPNLERLAARGVRFERARSTAPWTLPSHSSIMTGRWPHELSAGFKGPLDATYPTIAEYLGAKGYQTGGFVGNLIYTTRESGIGRGFVRYDDHDTTLLGFLRASTLLDRTTLFPEYHKRADRVGSAFLGWLDETPADRPFFAFLNFMDAHSPYGPPASFDRHFGVRPESPEDLATIENWFFLDKSSVTPRQVAMVNDTYDDGLAYLDDQLGKLFDELDRRGQLENTLVIVTGDHGEHFGEHKLFGHASSLYDPEIHVPLLILPPRGEAAGLSVRPIVSIRDLAATIVDVIGFEDDPFPGQSLARHWNADADPNAPLPAVLSEVEGPAPTTANHKTSPAFRGAMQSLVEDEKMYVRNGDGIEEFYDLESDPEQLENIIDTPAAQRVLDRFRNRLKQMLTEDEPTRRSAFDQGTHPIKPATDDVERVGLPE